MRQSGETMTSVSAGQIIVYTDTDPTSREQVDTAVIEPRTSSPGVARSTDWATMHPILQWNQSVHSNVNHTKQWQQKEKEPAKNIVLLLIFFLKKKQ